MVLHELRKHGDIVAAIELPCGQCVGCRIDRTRSWAIRIMHEASMHKSNCFLTLTYNDANLPFRGQLDYRDFQGFMKRLRQRWARHWKSQSEQDKAIAPPLRFYTCAEYGELHRPHFHACMFGLDAWDKRPVRLTTSHHKYWSSQMLAECWGKGFVSIGELTPETAAYVASYCQKKVTGKAAPAHYRRVDEHGEYQLPPEFARMSLRKGIGEKWLKKFNSDVYPSGLVVHNGVQVKSPRYYDLKLEEEQPVVAEELKIMRLEAAKEREWDNTSERLLVREQVSKARQNSKRKIL